MSNQMAKSQRKYELKARAEGQERTRQRIAQAAAELHEEVGPARTTVAEIARRAGVSRLTVYKHFPDNAALYPVCSAHFATQHPLPDFAAALAPDDPVRRVRSVLRTVYTGLYRERRAMMRNLYRDREVDPALDAFMRDNLDAAIGGLEDALVAGFGPESGEPARLRAMIGVALAFWTWERLVAEGMKDEDAAELMTAAVAAAAGTAVTAR
jgi:AcrR family transcriptional regulator